MTDPFAGVAEALSTARDAWGSAAVAGASVEGMSGPALVALNDAIASLRKQVDAVHVQVAAQVARQSRPELGNAGLARQQGFRSPTALIAASTGGTSGDAARLVAVGEATAPRMTLTGESTPPKYPSIATAVSRGRLGVDAAAAIGALLDKVALRAGREAILEAEATLVEKAVGLRLEEVHKLLQRAEAWLDPDGVEPREDELRAQNGLHIREDRTGRFHFSGTMDPENGAPIKTAIEGIVGTCLRQRDERGQAPLDDNDRRTIPQLQAEALAAICRHALACEDADVPTAGATVVVRVSLEQLESGIGHGTIDGVTQPVSIATVRRMAADADIIPCVLGGDSEILDFGRSRRRFSSAQKLALGERDGGCAGCGLPPGMTQVHHIRWWERDAGPTDLSNGILLCVRCHHRIHDDGWTIEITGKGVQAQVWFTPPPHVDVTRTPRLGGRARRDYLAA